MAVLLHRYRSLFGDDERALIELLGSQAAVLAERQTALAHAAGLGTRLGNTVEALRRAFEGTLKDPEFIGEAAKMQLEIEPLTGGQIDKLLAKAYGSPTAIVQRAVELLEPLGRR